MALVEIEDLVKEYRTASERITVLRHIDLTVEPGSTVVISGESGCGKTTLLSLLGGLDSPSSGRISVDGLSISSLSEDELVDYRGRTIGFVFQFHFLLGDFTALENVLMPALIVGADPSRARDRAESLLESVELQDRLDHTPSMLSGGERQRVAVARALMNDPAIVLADEPTGNLDERNSALVQEMLFRIVEEHHRTLLVVTHDELFGERVTDEVWEIEGRRLHLR